MGQQTPRSCEDSERRGFWACGLPAYGWSSCFSVCLAHCGALCLTRHSHCRLPYWSTSLGEQKLKLLHVPVSCALSWVCPTSAWHPVDVQQELIKLNPQTVQLPWGQSPQELRQDLPGIFVHARPSRAPTAPITPTLCLHPSLSHHLARRLSPAAIRRLRPLQPTVCPLPKCGSSEP